MCFCDVAYVENRRCDEFCEAIFFDSMCDEVGWWTGGGSCKIELVIVVSTLETQESGTW